MNIDVVDVVIDNPYNIEDFNKDFEKNGYFKTEVDSYCTTSDNSKITLEIQCNKLEYYVPRSLYYAFIKYCSGYGNETIMTNQDIKYSSLTPTYSINILNYKHFKDIHAIHKFEMYDRTNEIVLNEPYLIVVGYFEITKEDNKMATILVVEDNKNTQILTTARLKPYFEVMCANDGLEAMDIIYKQHIDIIVSDIMMPNMDGYELVKRLRSENFDMTIILLTAKASFEDKKEGFHLGTDDYMTKPVNYDELLIRVNALIRRAKIAVERKIVVGSIIIDA